MQGTPLISPIFGTAAIKDTGLAEGTVPIRIAGGALVGPMAWSQITTTPTTLNGYGITDGVRSVGLSLPAQFTISDSPVTGTGTLTAVWASQPQSHVLAAPIDGNGTPAFRALVATDIPALNQNTTGTAANVTGIVAIANGGTGATTDATARTALGATTVGSNLFTLANPSDITFPRLNADNTVSALNASDFRTAIAVPPINDPSFTGNVGIGTSSPGAKLDVSGGDALIHGVRVGRGAGNIDSNTAIGASAFAANTTGNNNAAIGFQTLFNNTTGSGNTAIGFQNLRTNTTGSNNTAIGFSTLFNNTTGSGNIGIGETNSAGVHAPVFNVSNQNNRIVMGHTAVTNAYVQVAWTVVSDARDKTQIEPLNLGLDFVEKLNPVSFKFRVSRDSEQTNGGKHYGFLAQEVLTIEGEDPVIVDTEDPEKLKMTNEELVPILVNAIQELKAEFDAYKASHP